MPLGAQISDEDVHFRLWAPKHDSIGLQIDGDLRAMTANADGWHESTVSGIGPGIRYAFVLPDGTTVPDPASRFQPDDVHGPSELIDPSEYRWADTNWRGRRWEEFVVYELHVGAFTLEGTFKAAKECLSAWRDLGITAIELMPVAEFPGERSWGYDGVLPYAPDATYGRRRI
jgi:1,4-alpha-glucan branching enzyme